VGPAGSPVPRWTLTRYAWTRPLPLSSAVHGVPPAPSEGEGPTVKRTRTNFRLFVRKCLCHPAQIPAKIGVREKHQVPSFDVPFGLTPRGFVVQSTGETTEKQRSSHLPSFVACHPAAAYNLSVDVAQATLVCEVATAFPFQGVWGIPPAAGGKRLKTKKRLRVPPGLPAFIISWCTASPPRLAWQGTGTGTRGGDCV